jgi:glycosyltransferase involved in cell wall biosynthesis
VRSEPTPLEPDPFTILYGVESMERAGAERVVASLVRYIDRARFRPIVCCLTIKGELAEEIESQGVPVIALHKHPHFDLPVIPKLISLLKKHRVDIVHSHVWPADVWCRFVGKAVGTPGIVVTEHNVDLWKRKTHLTLDRWLSRWTDRIICVSEAVKRFYTDEAGIAPEKLVAVPNGIDPAPFQVPVDSDRKRRELGLDPASPLLTVVARLLPQKSHRDFLRAMKTLRDKGLQATGLIVGDGPLRQELENDARALGVVDRVRFLGKRRDVPEILAITHVVVLSSVHEGMPLAALEGMAAGKPAVVTDVGGNREVVRDGVTGFVVPARDPAALAEAAAKLLRSPSLAESFGRAGRDRVEREFSVERMVRRNESIYWEILSAKTNEKEVSDE